jgi:hypothetical protein
LGPDCGYWVGWADFVQEKTSKMTLPEVKANGMATSQGGDVTRRMGKQTQKQ